jgi:Rieske Fe-S protein
MFDTGPGTMLPDARPDPGRREVLDWLLGTWLAGVLASVLYPIARYLVPPETPEAATQSVSGGTLADLAPNSARIVPFGAAPVILVRTASGDLRAFAATCTHLDCTVQYRADLEHFWCACHNGHYDLNGRNISGPPPRPLDGFDVNVSNDDIVIRRKA